MKRSFLWVLVILLLAASFSGCNMFKGFGKDIENAGEGIQKI